MIGARHIGSEYIPLKVARRHSAQGPRWLSVVTTLGYAHLTHQHGSNLPPGAFPQSLLNYLSAYPDVTYRGVAIAVVEHGALLDAAAGVGYLNCPATGLAI